jgi:Ca2+/Na+ antiporter
MAVQQGRAVTEKGSVEMDLLLLFVVLLIVLAIVGGLTVSHWLFVVLIVALLVYVLSRRGTRL